MARPLRLQFPGAVYHLTAHGNARQAIYLDDADRHAFLRLLSREVQQHRWRCYAYCLMSNHYHLLIETPEGNLVSGMRRLNGVYSQALDDISIKIPVWVRRVGCGSVAWEVKLTYVTYYPYHAGAGSAVAR